MCSILTIVKLIKTTYLIVLHGSESLKWHPLPQLWKAGIQKDVLFIVRWSATEPLVISRMIYLVHACCNCVIHSESFYMILEMSWMPPWNRDINSIMHSIREFPKHFLQDPQERDVENKKTRIWTKTKRWIIIRIEMVKMIYKVTGVVAKVPVVDINMCK